MSEVALVWAQSVAGVIGADGALPWHVPEDLARFKALTAGHPVVMGRATWDSLPPRWRPLPGRTNVVLTRQAGLELEGAIVVHDLAAALAAAADAPGGEQVWVVGGGAVYALALPHAHRVEATVLDVVVAGDTHAPRLAPQQWRREHAEPAVGWSTSSSGVRYRFETYLRAPA
ncbi:dihydrofolate reductase [Cellulomonas palmilytica]|uniref:dihydrofolate reductase n=1 Tax=Cellulomonas palmilytica TaxID=2608402 RepID=UPI001F3E2161|nr:dihydrofolate reductase [Cellulomonas palmilytica]UJP38711.1 dihydrofolate reductase [Cellulomonas palmilytica]